MRERMMIALHNVIEAHGGAIVAGNREADRIGAVARWESHAAPARVSKVAERLQGLAIGLPRLARDGAAEAVPIASQRQSGVFRTATRTLRRYRVEVGTRHSGGMVPRPAWGWFERPASRASRISEVADALLVELFTRQQT